MSRLIAIVIGFLLLPKSNAQNFSPSLSTVKLSPNAQVSILEIDRANDELFQVFGHIAIYVKDSTNYIDRVYSYGAFDFNTSGFYWKFITGRLPYQLAVSNLQYTILEYGPQYENRSIVKYTLNLNTDQKQKVFNLLETNYLPENRTYNYKFFKDNCSTRIRDIFEKALGKNLTWGKVSDDKLSYRTWMNSRLYDKTFAGFFMNMAIGLPSDHVCSDAEAMYIPQNMGKAFASGKNGAKPLVTDTGTLYKSTRAENRSMMPFGIMMVFLGVAFGYMNRWPRAQNVIAKGLLFVFGLVGILILFLWFFTAHGVTELNLSILWAWPTHIWAAFKLNDSRLRTYFKIWTVAALVYCLINFCLIVFTQATFSSLIPFIFIAAIAFIKIFGYFKKAQNLTE